MNDHSKIVLSVEKLIDGGYGLSRNSDGEVILLEGVLPSEEVVATITKRTQGVLRGEVVEIKKSSTKRREPLCKYFNNCGGCNWLFIDYQTQLELKREIFLENMKRIGKLENIPTPKVFKSFEFGYRRRAQLKINSHKEIGFYKRDTNIVVPISKCILLCQPINELISYLTDTPYLIPPNLTNLKVIATDSGVISAPTLPSITQQKGIISCEKFNFEIYGNDFFQNNIFLISQMGLYVASLSGKGDILIDLYGGTGFFSVFAAEQFNKVYLIEISEEMAERAKRNFMLNKITNAESIASSAELAIEKFSSRVDVVIVDPPRPGLTRKVREDIINKLSPQKIVYVSCNCSTQARDVSFFVKKGGYTISHTSIFDLYPNTSHIESIVVLEKIR